MPDDKEEVQADLPLTEEQVSEETQTEVAEEPKVEPKKEEAAQPLTAAAIGDAVRDAIRPQGLTAEQQESQWQQLEAETGFTRQQLLTQHRLAEEAALRRSAPLAQEAGISRADKILSGNEELVAKVKDKMKAMPLAVQADPSAWEEAAYMIKGRYGVTPTRRTDREEAPGKVLGGGGDKVSAPLSEGRGSNGGGAPRKQTKQYTADEQLIISRYFGGKAEDYEAQKARKGLRAADASNGSGNAADKALAQLSGGAF